MTKHNNPIANEAEEHLVHSQKSLGGRLRQYFFTGIVVTAPITLTLWATWWFLRSVDSFIGRMIPAEYNPNNYLPFSVPGLGLIVAIVFFILIGWFARNFLGRLIIRVSEFIVGRMPIVNTVYNALKQVLEMTIGSQSKAFREVVLFEYPRKDCWTIGFVTGVTKGEVQSVSDGEVVNVYIPTTPTTAGFLLFVPRKDCVTLSMTVEEAVKLIVSGGIITPERG
jgi:uncharacterized membrane protein